MPMITPSRLLFPVLVGLVTAATIVSATWFISVSEQRRQAQTERLDTLRQMSAVWAPSGADLTSRAALAKSMTSYVATHGEIDHETFRSLVEGLVAGDNMIRNVSLLKITGIVDVCPRKGNEKAIGTVWPRFRGNSKRCGELSKQEELPLPAHSNCFKVVWVLYSDSHILAPEGQAFRERRLLGTDKRRDHAGCALKKGRNL